MYTKAKQQRFVKMKVSEFKIVSSLVTQCAVPCQNAKPEAMIGKASKAMSQAK